MTRFREYACVFLLLGACYAYFFPRWADWNQNSRLDLIMSLVEERSFAIEKYVANTGDYALIEGRYYSDKAPGMAILGAPVYAAFRAVAGEAADALTARIKQGETGALTATLNPTGAGLAPENLRIFAGLIATAMVAGVLPAALLGAVCFWVIGRLGGSSRERLVGTLAYALATPAFPYANSLVGHQTAAALLFGAFALVFAIRQSYLARRWLPTAGFLLGYAVITEYPTALIASVLGSYALVVLNNRRQVIAGLILGALAPVLALVLYDIGAFGTPLPIGYFHSTLWADVHQAGFVSLTYPHVEALAGITVGAHRGLFFLSPYLLLAAVGYRRLWRRWPAETIALGAAPLVYLLYNASSAMWSGGYGVGPRYLVASLPFLAVPAAFGLSQLWQRHNLRPLMILVVTWSFCAVWAETVGGQAFPDYTENTLLDYSWPKLAAGDIARNAGMVVGLAGWSSLVPLLAIGGLLTGLAFAPRRLALKRVHIGERAGAVAVICAVVVLTALPYVYGYRVAGADRAFMGIVLNVPDTAQYFSWARESEHALLIANKLTPEAGAAVYFNLFWWAIGQFAAATRIGIAETTQLVRPFAGAAYIASIYWLCRQVCHNRAERWVAFLVGTVGGGLGWVLIVAKQYSGSLSAPLDVYVTEANTFLTVMAFPLQAMAGALLIFALGLAALALQRNSTGLAAVAGVLGLLLGLQHGYDLLIMYAVIASVAAVMLVRGGSRARIVGLAVLACGPSVPAAAYLAYLTRESPIWRGVLSQYGNAGVYTPSPLHLLLLMGLPMLVLILAGPLAIVRRDDIRNWLRSAPGVDLLIWGWLLVGSVLVYIPTDFQIKMLAGWQVPMAIAASRIVVGFLHPRLQRIRVGLVQCAVRFVPLAAVVVVLPVNMYLLAWRFVDLGRADHPYYLTHDEAGALDWLAANSSPSAIVLSSLTIGQYVPSVAGNTAFLAHWAQTLDFYTKRRLVEEYFTARSPEGARARMLDTFGVEYVFYGPEERSLGAYDPASSESLKRVYGSPTVSIYEVNARMAETVGAQR